MLRHHALAALTLFLPLVATAAHAGAGEQALSSALTVATKAGAYYRAQPEARAALRPLVQAALDAARAGLLAQRLEDQLADTLTDLARVGRELAPRDEKVRAIVLAPLRATRDAAQEGRRKLGRAAKDRRAEVVRALRAVGRELPLGLPLRSELGAAVRAVEALPDRSN